MEDMKAMRFKFHNAPIMADAGLLCLRLFFSLPLAIVYGWPAIYGILTGNIDYPDPIGLGQFASQALMGFAQFCCAILVVLGVFARAASIPIAIGFAVAFFVFHTEDPFMDKELAYLYMTAFICIILVGSGKFSLDRVFRRSKNSV